MLLAILKPEHQYQELTPSEYQQAFKEYFRTIRNFIYFKCSDMDMAEDLAQDTFLKLWETRHRIDKRTIKAYLYTIAQNNTINQLKRKQLMYKFIKIPAADREYDTPEKIAEMKEYEVKLANVIAMLPDGGREVFLMNRMEELTYVEIAGRLGLSVKAIEKRMSKVLQIFRDQLGTEI
ncbi:MAG: sigma-70 family RNA polymerase sigma factor [Flavobacteriales bacterium]